MTYTPLQQNQTPIQGTSGAAVLALQKELNAKGAGLKEDALYGPLTAAAYAKYNTPVNQTPVQKSTFVEPTLASYETDPNYKYAQDVNTKLMRGEDIVDTNAIRSQTLAGFQDRINALTQIYAGKLAEAKQQGVGRVGQTTAILANRGLAGSARGGAIAEGTLQQNAQVENAIANEQAVAISNIYGLANQVAVEEAARKRAAIEGGAKSYIDFVKNQEVTKKDNLNNFASAFIAQGIDPSTMTPEQLKGLSDKLKVSTSDIISAYKQKQYEKQQADLKANPKVELSQGASLMVFNPVTGKYEQQGYNPKTSTTSGGTGIGTNNTITDNERALMTQFRSEPIVKDYNEILGQKGTIDAYIQNGVGGPADLAIVFSFMKGLDPTSVVRESEYDNAAKSGNIFQGAWAKFNGYFKDKGGMLPANVRQEFQNLVNQKLAVKEKQYKNVKKQYEDLAGRQQLNPQNVVLDYAAGGSSAVVNEADPLRLFN